MNRRDLLHLGGGAALSVLSVSTWLDALAGHSQPRLTNGKVLVWLELRGANDGLNTVIPFRDSLYHKARPSLAIDAGPVLSDRLILHPALSPLLPVWSARRLAFALGVGWPQPNRSHFFATDQWSTASPSGTGIGWLASAVDNQRSPGPLIALSASGSSALDGGRALSLQMSAADLRSRDEAALNPDRAGTNPTLRSILQLEQAGHREVSRLRRLLKPLPKGLELPRNNLGQQVGLALQLIACSAPPPVLQMAHGGFDTHSAQDSRHHKALADLADALAAFDRGLRSMPRRPQVTLLVTSEFGRRLRENQSRGTDHGSASVAFLLGDHVPHPFLGAYPSLARLDDRGDLVPSLSPPDLYRQVLAL